MALLAPLETIAFTVAALFIVFALMILLIFSFTFAPWLRALTSGTPVSLPTIIGMRLRRTPIGTVLRFLIMARHAGLDISCREMKSAYLQGADLEKLTLAMIHAKREGKDIPLQDLVEADLEDRLAEKLGR